jgi:hypothetical protein
MDTELAVTVLSTNGTSSSKFVLELVQMALLLRYCSGNAFQIPSRQLALRC